MDDTDDRNTMTQEQREKAVEDLLDAALVALRWLERNTTGDVAEAKKLRAAIAEVNV